MGPFVKVSDDVLADSLTEYYTRYSKFLKEGGDRNEFESCRRTLISLLHELNGRRARPDDLDHIEEAVRSADPI